ncbi:beta-lactamase family protein [Ferruginibacter lapsinanis]|uniref:serine hydrolase domain-containing protein n=1 Tax=Ferruginibacter lapsinanis TaxID=563172 RepID=UPI001E652490|nr:serine hydrolase domain-containing protein [Ferruginibacter lapsinanis]UEG49947.1 beta-lactamase family protein [Ferruginibacter lapsinanis]
MTYKLSSICRKCSIIAIFLLLLQVSHAQNFNKVNDWLVDNLQSLGGRAVLVIYKDGKIIYNHAENNMSRKQKMIGKFIAKKKGLDKNEGTQDFNSTTRELIASSSKWLTAALVMTFVEEGNLSLEDSVGKFLPVMTANGKGGIKIWQCLSHLTGIKAPPLKEGVKEITSAASMDDAIEKIAQLPMEGEPGKAFHYSNVGLQIAAAVVEKISGLDFKTAFSERIAYRCNMLNTDWGDGNVPLAAGGARSTAEDYIKFLTMILNEGIYDDNLILSKNNIVEMQKNRVPADATIAYSPAEAGSWGYGFGEWIMDGATSEIRSNAVSSPGLFGSFPWVDNNKKYAAFLMTFNIKSRGRNEKYRELKKLVDEEIGN